MSYTKPESDNEVHYHARLVIERVEKNTGAVTRGAESPKRGVTEVMNLAVRGTTLASLARKLLKHIDIIVEDESA